MRFFEMLKGRPLLTESEINKDKPMSLQTIADWMAYMNDDILPERFLEIEWLKASDKDCLKLIRQVYLHGDCGPFAYALHKKHGWPTFRIFDRNYNHHYACKRPDGMFFDFTGPLTLEDIIKRYKFRKAKVEEVDPNVCIIDTDDENPWDEAKIAKFMIDYLRY